MNNYDQSFADYYDLFYAQKDYASEAGFISGLCSGKTMGKVLELAGGTGNHCAHLHTLCEEYVFTEKSDRMLSIARSKLKDPRINFLPMDMTNFVLPDSKFDVILCLFDSIGYLLSNENITKTFENVRDHLTDQGIFVMEYWHAAPFLKGYEPTRVKEFKSGRHKILRISDTQLDYDQQKGIVNYTVLDIDENQQVKTYKEQHENRFFLPLEMESILDGAGLEEMHRYGGYNSQRSINADAWHIVSVSRKR